MPKVVFVNRYYDPDQSATSQMLTDLARRLAASGIAVHVVCSRQRYDDAGAALPSWQVLSGVTVHRIWTSRFGRDQLLGRAIDYASFYLAAGWRLSVVLRRDDIVVAKTDPPLISIVAMVVARLRSARLINWLQDVFPEVAGVLDANLLPVWLATRLTRWRDTSLRAAAMNVVIGERMRLLLLRRGIPAARIRVIENWADDHAITPRPASASNLRRELGADAEFVVCYSGNFGRAHDFETLLEAATQLREDRGILFLMIGAGAKLAALKQAVVVRGLDNFRFLPFQPREQLADSLAAADVHLATLVPELEGLIVPSKFYGILAAGRPTLFVGDPGGEVARVLVAHRCGEVVAVGKAGLLAAAIRDLRENPDVCAAMGSRARALCESRYTADRAAINWRDVLQGTVGETENAAALVDH